MAKSGRIVNKRELSEVFGISVQAIDGWLARGCPYLEKGAPLVGYKFDTAAVVEWRSQQAVAEAIAHSPSEGKDDGDARLTNAQATLAELKLARELGQLVTLEDVQKVWDRLTASCRARLLSVPSKTAAAARASETNEHARAVVAAAIAEALDELGSTGIDEPDSVAGALEVGRSADRQSEASAEVEPERMGRQPAKTQPGGKRRAGAVDNGAR